MVEVWDRVNKIQLDLKDLFKESPIPIGSFEARTLAQYQEILTHNGSHDLIDYAKKDLDPILTIVDAGSSAGIALAQMREVFAYASLHAIDLDNMLDKSIECPDKSHIKVPDLFSQVGITFHQDDFNNILNILPGGYDILFSVGTFFTIIYQVPISLKLINFYKGLRKRGMAQVLINTSDKYLQFIFDALTKIQARYEYRESNRKILLNHGLDLGDRVGTLTLGPK